MTALGVMLLGGQLVTWLNQPALKSLLWLLPVGVLLSGMYQSFSYWAVRRRRFDLLAQTKFRQSIFGVATNLATAPLGTIGLLLGHIVSQCAGFLQIFSQQKLELQRWPLKPFILIRAFVRYSSFGIYSSQASLVNAIGNQAPNLIFAAVFGTQQLGQLSLAQRLLLVPASLISNSVGQVFLGDAANAYRDGRLPLLVRTASRKLFLYGFLITSLACFALAPLMPLIFGKSWAPTQLIIPILTPLVLGQLCISPLSMAFIAAQANKCEFFAQVILASLRLFPLILCVFIGLEFKSTLIVYSLTSFAGYCFYGFLLMRSI